MLLISCFSSHAASCFLLHQWWAFLTLTPSMPVELEFGVTTKHARRLSMHASNVSFGWHWWANNNLSHQACKQREVGVTFLVFNFDTSMFLV